MKPYIMALVVAALSTTLQAQASPDSIQRRNDCRLAEQVLLHGQSQTKHTWALRVFPSCEDAAGHISVTLLNRMGADAQFDSAFISAASSRIDPLVARRAAELASDASRSEAVRVNSLRLLYAQAEPESPLSYSELTRPLTLITEDSSATRVTRRLPAPSEFVIDRGPTYGPGLDAVLADQLAGMMNTVRESENTPPAVRTAATRVAEVLRTRARQLRVCPSGTPAQTCVERLQAGT